MRQKLRRAGNPGPKVIGIDEISILNGHTYRIVVSDLERRQLIRFGGADRSEESLNRFFEELGPKKARKIRLAVMDMWKSFEKSTRQKSSRAFILYDKFHFLWHLNEALDKSIKSEYARLTGSDRRFNKGQPTALLSHRENLSLEGRKALHTLFAANIQLNTAYVLKKTFGQLWDYPSATGARKLFDNWKVSLKWQRLQSYEKFAMMIERHCDDVAAFCKLENKV
jgi:transposase